MAKSTVEAPVALPTLSVIVTTHDVGPWIGELVTSILKQDVRDLEVLLVDDHSSDDTLAQLRDAQRRDPRVSVIRTEQRGGANARNVGVAAASGEYIVFADGDDIVPKHAYSRMLHAAAAGRPDIVFGDFLKFSSSRTWRPSRSWSAFESARSGIRLDDEPSLVRNRACWNKLFRRDFWMASGAVFPEVPRSNDIVPMVTAYLAADSIAVVPDVVYLYRERPGTSSMSSLARPAIALASYLTQELACARLIVADDGDATLPVYFSMMLEADAWSHLERFLTGPGIDDPAAEEIPVLWRELLLLAPRRNIIRAAPLKQLVLALIAAGALAEARAVLLAQSAETPVAERLEAWRVGVDRLQSEEELGRLIGTARIIRAGLLEPMLASVEDLDDARIAEILDWLTGLARFDDLRQYLGESGRSIVAAYTDGGVDGIRTLAAATEELTAEIDTAKLALRELHLAGAVTGAGATKVGVRLLRDGQAYGVDLGSVSTDAAGRFALDVPLGRFPSDATWSIRLRVPVEGAGFASVVPQRTVAKLAGIAAERRGFALADLDDGRFAVLRTGVPKS